MKFLRPVYFLFLFSLVILVLFRPERLRAAPRPGYEIQISFGIFVLMVAFFGYYSVRTFLKDWRTVRGGTKIARAFPLKLDSAQAKVLGPISGEGSCQIRLKIKKMPPDPGRDEIEICILDEADTESEKQSLGFAFGKEDYEVEVPNTGAWSLRIQIKFVQKPSEPFAGRVHLQLLGRAQNVNLPETFVVR